MSYLLKKAFKIIAVVIIVFLIIVVLSHFFPIVRRVFDNIEKFFSSLRFSINHFLR